MLEVAQVNFIGRKEELNTLEKEFHRYFDDGYFYLMPGESKEIRFQVDCKEGVDKMLLRVDGYNVESKDILLNK